MKTWLVLLFSFISALAADSPPAAVPPLAGPKKVYVLPIREDIMPPLLYLVRRGVKEAMEANADLLVLDMKTNGGRVDTTDEIVEILGKFQGQTVTYVNNRAFSAGAFLSVATQKIYMAPQSVIGAAAPIMISPTGDGVQKLPEVFEAKMVSGVSALVRTSAEKNGHDVDVIEAMIDKSRELKRVQYVRQPDGSQTAVTNVLNEVGRILTLTDRQAAKEYGNPPKPLLSSGTVGSLDDLLKQLGYAEAKRVDLKPTGAEQLGFWINAISPILLLIGIVGIYIEFKTPGFGLPGIVGIAAFALYFVGGYVAGFSGLEWMLVFLLGLILVLLEVFVFTGTMALGITGALLMLVAIVMALVDVYPRTPAPPSVTPGPSLPGLPNLPALTAADFNRSLFALSTALAGSVLCILVLRRFMPKTAMYHTLVSQSASGVASVAALEQRRAVLEGAVGVALSNLRPGGKAQFGDEILDVITQGDLVAKGRKVRILGYSGTEAIVEVVDGEKS